MNGKLTKAQAGMLQYLDTRRSTMHPSRAVGGQIGMLRIMEENRLVARNSHGYWFITALGRASLKQGEPM